MAEADAQEHQGGQCSRSGLLPSPLALEAEKSLRMKAPEKMLKACEEDSVSSASGDAADRYTGSEDASRRSSKEVTSRRSSGSKSSSSKRGSTEDVDDNERGIRAKVQEKRGEKSTARFSNKPGAITLNVRDRSMSERMMDELLNNEETCQHMLGDLLNQSELHSVWESLKERMTGAEDQLDSIGKYLNREVFERDFVLADEYRLTVEGAHHTRLEDLEERVPKAEQDIDAVTRRLDKKRSELDVLQTWRKKVDATLIDADNPVFRELTRIEDQDMDHHRIMLDHIGRLDQMFTEEKGFSRQKFEEVTRRQTQEEETRQALSVKVKKMNDFIAGSDLIQHIKTCCREILKDYIPWSEMDSQSLKNTKKLLSPVHSQLDKLQDSLNESNDHHTTTHDKDKRVLETQVEKIKGQLHEHGRVHMRVWDAIEIRPTSARVKDMETDIQKRIYVAEDQTQSLTEASTQKFEEVVKRLCEFQNIMESHEHALKHQAEELSNRATKYDLVLHTHRIDVCAIKSKVESEFVELGDIIKWQTQKIEEIIFSEKCNPNENSEAGKKPFQRKLSRSSCGSDGDESVENEVEGRKSISQMVPQEMITVRQQLTALAEAAVMFADHVLVQSHKSMTRDAKREKEGETMHNLSSVAYWIQNRRVPLSWDASKLKTQATLTMLKAEQNQEDEVMRAIESPGRKAKGVQLCIDGTSPAISRSDTGNDQPETIKITRRDSVLAAREKYPASPSPRPGSRAALAKSPDAAREERQEWASLKHVKHVSGRVLGAAQQKRAQKQAHQMQGSSFAGALHKEGATGLEAQTKAVSSLPLHTRGHDEDHLKDLVTASLNMGFSPTASQIRSQVSDVSLPRVA